MMTSEKRKTIINMFIVLLLSISVFSFALIFFAPRIVMLIAERRFTNVDEITNEGKAPLNSTSHVNRFPTADDTIIVRPNADTFYSSGWYNLKDTAWLMDVPESDGRYFSIQFNDMWTNAFAYGGLRTHGTAAQTYLLMGPNWTGTVAPDTELIRCNTSKVWIIVRTMVYDEADREYVRLFQQGITITPYNP